MITFPSHSDRYDLEMTDQVFGDSEWIRTKLCEVKKMERVLDLACGTGRASVALARGGSEVTGVDSNKDALDIYGLKTSTILDLKKPKLLCRDLNSFFPQGSWDVVMFVGNSVGILSGQQRLEDVLKASFESLNPGGIFLMTIVLLEFGPTMDEIASKKPKRFSMKSNLEYERRYKYQVSETEYKIEFTYFVDGQEVRTDVITATRFDWQIIKSIAVSIFGKENVSCDLIYHQSNAKPHQPFEVFFSFKKPG